MGVSGFCLRFLKGAALTGSTSGVSIAKFERSALILRVSDNIVRNDIIGLIIVFYALKIMGENEIKCFFLYYPYARIIRRKNDRTCYSQRKQ